MRRTKHPVGQFNALVHPFKSLEVLILLPGMREAGYAGQYASMLCIETLFLVSITCTSSSLASFH